MDFIFHTLSKYYIDKILYIGYNMKAEFSLRGRTGFDGDFEAAGASSGGHRFNQPKLKINANDNLAYAA